MPLLWPHQQLVGANAGSWQTALTIPYNATYDSGARTWVSLIPASAYSISGSQVRITLQATYFSGDSSSWESLISPIYIGHRAASGDAYDFDGNQVPLLFDGVNAVYFDTNDALHSSDEIAFNFDASRDFLLSWYSDGIPSSYFAVNDGRTSSHVLYQGGTGNTVATTNKSGFSSYWTGATAMIREIEVWG